MTRAAVVALVVAVSGSPVGLTGQERSTYVTETIETSMPMATFGGMGGVAVDREGFVYVADFGNSVWRVRAASGETELLTDALYGSSGNVVTPKGDLLQAEFVAGRIRRIDREGRVHDFSGEGLVGPVGLTYGPGGDVFVADCMAGRIARVPAVGGAAQPFATHDAFACPNGITYAPDGNLYVVNNVDTRLFRISGDGEVTILAHLPGSGHGHIVAAQRALFVTQLWNHEVIRVELDGTVTSVSGNGRAGEADGPTGVSEVKHPNGLATSGTTLYFNTISGPMMLGDEARLELRRVVLPTPFRTLRAAYRDGGLDRFRERFARLSADGDVESIVPQAALAADMMLQEGQVEPGLAIHDWLVERNPLAVGSLTGAADAHAHYGNPTRAVELYARALRDGADDDLAKKLEYARRLVANRAPNP